MGDISGIAAGGWFSEPLGFRGGVDPSGREEALDVFLDPMSPAVCDGVFF